MKSPPEKEAPLAWRQDGARLGSLGPNVDNSRRVCKRVQQRPSGACSAKSPLHQANAIVVNHARRMIRSVIGLSLSLGPVKLTIRPTLLGRKMTRDANSLVLDLPRKSLARKKSRVYDRVANIGSDK